MNTLPATAGGQADAHAHVSDAHVSDASASAVDGSDSDAAVRTPPAIDLPREVSASLLRLKLKSPFFATLALHARFVPSTDVPTMATDGRDVFVNPEFAASLGQAHFDGVILHEVLHAALGHVTRRGMREAQRWNVAADVVVNGLVLGNGFTLPDGAVIDAALAGYSVEEVYVLLAGNDRELPSEALDLLEAADDGRGRGDGRTAAAKGTAPGDRSGNRPGSDDPGAPGAAAGALGDAQRRALERHWSKAAAQAHAVARAQGTMPIGAARAFGLDGRATLDWRALLWRFLSPTATDFASFDRRFVHQGLYLETLQDESLRIAVAIDTSGSIDEQAMGALLAEVRAVLAAYPSTECALYYADAEVYGPWTLTATSELPQPQGGGGTDFRPFFAAIEHDDAGTTDGRTPGVCIYLTDGFGDFPEEPPAIPTLWAVTPGGLNDDGFPFGEVARIV